MVSIALVVIFVVAVSLQYFYIFINNLLYFRYYRNKNVKILPIQYVMRTNKVTIIGFITGIILLTFNIGINVIYVISASVTEGIIVSINGIEIINQYQIDTRVLVSFIFIYFLVLIGFIICFVFALRGKIGAGIAGALLMIALMFFTLIWVVGPVFSLITALIIFNGHEKVTDIKLIEAHNLQKLKKTTKAQKKFSK